MTDHYADARHIIDQLEAYIMSDYRNVTPDKPGKADMYWEDGKQMLDWIEELRDAVHGMDSDHDDTLKEVESVKDALRGIGK